MKKTILAAALLCLAGVVVTGQSKPLVEWDEATPLDTDDNTVQGIQLADGVYCAVEFSLGGFSGKQVTARLFDRKGKKLKERKFKFESQSKAFLTIRPQVERLIEFRGRYYFLLKEIDPKAHRILLHSWAFDPATLTAAQDPVTIGSVEVLDYRLTSYNWTISRTEDVLYVLEVPGKGSTPAATLTIKAYDPELTLLHERRFTLPPEVEFLKVDAFSVEHGHVVIASRNYEKRPPLFAIKMPAFKLYYFILPKGGSELRSVPIELPGVMAFEANHVFEGPDGFIGYGLYSKSTADRSAGAFVLRYSLSDGKLGAPRLRAFPPSIVESADDRNKRSTSDETAGFRVAHLRIRPDGGMQFIAEQSNNYWLSYDIGNFDGSMSMNVQGTVFLYDDILVYTLYDDPSRDWFTLIRKRQLALGTDRHFSFTHTYDAGGTLLMLYNDLPENLTRPPSKRPDDLKDGGGKMGTVLARIDPKGNISKELLFTRKDIGHAFAPRQTAYLEDGTMVLTAFAKHSFRVGRLSLGQ